MRRRRGRVFAAHGDDARADRGLGRQPPGASSIRCQYAAMLEAVEHAIEHARARGLHALGARAARLEGHRALLRADAGRGGAALARSGAPDACARSPSARRSRGEARPFRRGARPDRGRRRSGGGARPDDLARGRRDGGLGGRDACGRLSRPPSASSARAASSSRQLGDTGYRATAAALARRVALCPGPARRGSARDRSSPRSCPRPTTGSRTGSGARCARSSRLAPAGHPEAEAIAREAVAPLRRDRHGRRPGARARRSGRGPQPGRRRPARPRPSSSAPSKLFESKGNVVAGRAGAGHPCGNSRDPALASLA